MTDKYFNERSLCREVLIWSVAVRHQLGRWEQLVARRVLSGLSETDSPFPGQLIWQAAIERHFLIIAARNLIKAISLAGFEDIDVDSVAVLELQEGRNLLEHWDENLPVFNVRPRPRDPKHPSGRRFAERNPDRGPSSAANWASTTGPMVLPNVPAAVVHNLVDKAQRLALGPFSEMAHYIPERESSPWIERSGEMRAWWPRQDLED